MAIIIVFVGSSNTDTFPVGEKHYNATYVISRGHHRRMWKKLKNKNSKHYSNDMTELGWKGLLGSRGDIRRNEGWFSWKFVRAPVVSRQSYLRLYFTPLAGLWCSCCLLTWLSSLFSWPRLTAILRRTHTPMLRLLMLPLILVYLPSNLLQALAFYSYTYYNHIEKFNRNSIHTTLARTAV